jgi:hypothetical protein
MGGVAFHDVHQSSGGRRSKQLFALLHYKFDIDLASKTETAMREKQHFGGSRYYEPFVRLLAGTSNDIRFDGSRQFKGVQSLVNAELAFFCDSLAERAVPDGDALLADIVAKIWKYGDYRLQQQVWESAWDPANGPVTRSMVAHRGPNAAAEDQSAR